VNRRFGGKYRLHLQGRKIRERGTSVSRWLHTEDGGNTFLRNIGSYKIYTAPHPRRRHSSWINDAPSKAVDLGTHPDRDLIGETNSVQIPLASFMDQNPSWGPNSRSIDHKISCLYCNPKIHYRAYKNSPLVLIVSVMNPGHIVTTYLFKIHFNITPSSTPRPPKWSGEVPGLKFVFISHVCYMPCPLLPRFHQQSLLCYWSETCPPERALFWGSAESNFFWMY
jgi:hypothetical protein